MNHPDLDGASRYALGRLERDLAHTLSYHSVAHTRDEVAPAALLLADMEGVAGEPRLLLLTAAYYHDIGYVQQPQDHELVSISIAESALPAFGYQSAQIRIVRQIIMASAAGQTPHSLLEQILVDADLDALGTEAYTRRSLDIRREWEISGLTMSDEEWYRGQVKLLESHRYWTQAARRLRGAGKQRNLELVRARLESLQI